MEVGWQTKNVGIKIMCLRMREREREREREKQRNRCKENELVVLKRQKEILVWMSGLQ